MRWLAAVALVAAALGRATVAPHAVTLEPGVLSVRASICAAPSLGSGCVRRHMS
jgi:hypothetical protein